MRFLIKKITSKWTTNQPDKKGKGKCVTNKNATRSLKGKRTNAKDTEAAANVLKMDVMQMWLQKVTSANNMVEDSFVLKKGVKMGFTMGVTNA